MKTHNGICTHNTKIFTILLTSSFAILILLLSSVVFSYFLLQNDSVVENGKSTEEYRFVEYDSRTNHSFFGTLTTDPIIGDYLYENIVDGRHLLISKFGTNEYYCTGKCFCEEDRRSTSSTKSFSRGLVFLVAAFTSLLAYRRAKEYYDEKCPEQLSEQCPFSMISSEVDNCENISDEDVVEDTTETETTEDIEEEKIKKKKKKKRKKKKKEEEVFRKYWCKGSCVTDYRLGFFEEVWSIFEYKKPYREICEELFLKKEIELDRIDIMEDEETKGVAPVYKAKLKFVKHLDKFCILTTIWGKHKFAKHDILTFEREFFQEKTKSMCTANIRDKSVTCTQVFPSRREMTDEDWEHFDDDLRRKKYENMDPEERGGMTDEELREMYYSGDSSTSPGGEEWWDERKQTTDDPRDKLVDDSDFDYTGFKDTPFDEFDEEYEDFEEMDDVVIQRTVSPYPPEEGEEEQGKQKNKVKEEDEDDDF